LIIFIIFDKKYLKVDKKYRFIGIRPFEFSEKDIFFERDDITNKIIDIIDNNPLTVVHSKSGYGKTSVIKAGLFPRLKNFSQYKIIYTSFPNFFKNSEASPIKVLTNNIDENLIFASFWDKLDFFSEDLWYKIKRLSSNEDKTILLIIDQFENIFSFSEFEVTYFYEQIKDIFEAIPEKFKLILNQKIHELDDELTEEAKNKILGRIDFKILIAIRNDKLHKLKFFQKILNRDFAQIEIPAFTSEQAKNIFVKTSSFKPKYNIDDNFVSNPFEIGEKLLDEIILFMNNNGQKEIEPYQLQIIGNELEKISVKQLISKIDVSQISNFSDLYNDYYEAVINKISNPLQRMAARKFVEDELVFEYENRKLTVYQGVAVTKYKVTQETLDFLEANNIILQIKNNEETFYEISHDALLTPILIAKQNRIKREIRLEEELRQKEFFKKQAEKQELKSKRNKRIAIFLALALVIVGGLSVFAFYQRKQALSNQRIAQSSMYATLAFQKLESDPTIAFEYAQKSYELKNDNPLSVSALLNSFNKTGVFYSNVYKTGFNFINAVVAHNTKNIALIRYNDSLRQIVIVNDKAQILKVWDIKSIPSSISFSNDDKFLLVSYYNKTLTITNLESGEINEIKIGNIAQHVLMSPDDKMVLSVNDNNTLRIFDTNGKIIKLISVEGASIKYADFSNDGKKIVLSNSDGNIMVYNLLGKLIAEYDYIFEFPMQTNDFQPVKFSKDDKKILIVVNDYYHSNFQIIVWNYIENKVIAKIQEFDSWINTASFVDSVHILVTAKNGLSYYINYLNNETKILAGHSNEIYDASMNGDFIVTVSADNSIRHWKIYDFFSTVYENEIVKFSPNSRYVAKKTLQKIVICSILGDTIFSKNISGIVKYDFTNDDKYVIFQYADNVLIYSLLDNKEYKLKIKQKIIDLSSQNDYLIIGTKSEIYKVDYNSQIIDSIKLSDTANYKLWDEYIVIVDKNAININDFYGKTIKKLNIKNISKIIVEHNNISIIKSNTLYFSNVNSTEFNEIKCSNNILDAGMSIDGKLIYIVETKNKISVWDSNSNHLIDFKTPFSILNTEFTPNSLIIQYLDQKGRIKSVEKIISPKQILKFVDELKLYGNLYKQKSL